MSSTRISKEIQAKLSPISLCLLSYAANIVGNLVYGMDVNNFVETDHIINSYVNQPAQHACLQSL